MITLDGRELTTELEAHAATRVLQADGDLTLALAPVLCRAVQDALAAGSTAMTIDLRAATHADLVGLAALLQCAGAAERAGATLSIVPSQSLHAPVMAARLFEELPFVTSAPLEPSEVVPVDAPALGTAAPLLARTPRIGLRQPTWEELALFERWANDRCLDEMVGSSLLYRCRHLGAYHPDFVREVLASPTSLTLLVEPLATPGHPVGFVRIYDVNLVSGIAFLETVVTTGESLRKGWGVEASRLLLAYGMDVLGLQRVEAKVYGYNVLSANALRRNGFHQDGVLRAAHRYQGQRWDILVFSILADEMRAQRARERHPYVGFWGGS
ncbi:MAG: GNAT family N-acetyltransferase [Candidatus Rokubacteria bacterium]|nr:GNAT family N-acetyltransferase [Candidatus Rokubacteria bacterium]